MMNLLKSQRNHLDKITVKIFNYLHAHRSNKKKNLNGEIWTIYLTGLEYF